MRGGWVERGTITIRLGRPHFAFFRGYLDGLEIAALAQRYLAQDPAGGTPVHADLRLARSMVRWIREQLLVAARRTLSPADARLLGVEPSALTGPDPRALPSAPGLDMFRDEHDPYGMYAEAELLVLFEHVHGIPDPATKRRALRNQRLRVRQQRALQQLEMLVAADPTLPDPVEGWLDPSLAARLRAVGICSLADLVALIDRYGYRWYAKVPRIGLHAALHIGRWLQEDSVQQSLGVRLPPWALKPARALPAGAAAKLVAGPQASGSSGIVALERLAPPARLDGTGGVNRGERCMLAATDDLSAMRTWLASRDGSGHTTRSYRKEAERFLLWSLFECGKPISSLTPEDCLSYRRFLSMLGQATPAAWATRFRLPQTQWIGPRGPLRTSNYWRPFHGPLAAASQRQALTIVQSLLQWLTDQDYLYINPMKGMGARQRPGLRHGASRALTLAEWQSARVALQRLLDSDDTEAALRVRFILALGYGCGLRLSEIASLQRSHLVEFHRAGDSTASWQLVVTGKGGAVREVAIATPVMAAMRDYLASRGIGDVASMPSEIPLIAHLATTGPRRDGTADLAAGALGASRVYRIVKRFFAQAADVVETECPEHAARLRAASTHWLRHTFATHALGQGMPLDVLRDILGHRSLDTTSIYVTTERDRRSRAVDDFGKNALLP